MRMSCNGCRVLRKGCSDDCIIRPCLQWIKSSDAQANATLFLAKFYGRAGLINLIEAGPQHLRPAVFRSLLYEACGRIVNPVCGSVGLLWSGNWSQCQSAVDSVLRAGHITQTSSPSASDAAAPHLIIDPHRAAYDIRHVSKEGSSNNSGNGELNKVKNRTRFKRPVNKPANSPTESAFTTRAAEFGSSEAWASQSNSNDDDNTNHDQLGLDLTLALVPIQ